MKREAQSSQLAEPLWTDPGLKKKKKWNWCARADLHFQKKKSTGGEGMNRQTFPPNPLKRGKRPPPPRLSVSTKVLSCSTLSLHQAIQVCEDCQKHTTNVLFICLSRVAGSAIAEDEAHNHRNTGRIRSEYGLISIRFKQLTPSGLGQALPTATQNA